MHPDTSPRYAINHDVTTQSGSTDALKHAQGWFRDQRQLPVKDLLNKLAPEEHHVVLEAFTDPLKRFNRKSIARLGLTY
jgi:hypothetical protein